MTSRTENSFRNLKYGLAGQILSIIVGFVARTIFVRTLSAEYLGVNGLFANMMTVLSVAELGIGSAIVYSMYEPLAQRDEARLRALMGVYRRAYLTIGTIVALVGTGILPLMPLIIDDVPSVQYLEWLYILFVANASITYFFSYKRSLLIADQKRYITSMYRYGFFLALNILQIAILIAFHNYFFFLSAQVVFTLLENIAVSRHVDRRYPFLRQRPVPSLEQRDRVTIVRNVKALVLNRLSGAVRSGSDSILIAAFAGVVAAGLYSNYLLITNSLSVIFGVAFSSVTASAGNLNVLESRERQYHTFKVLDLFVYLLHSFAAVSLLSLLNPFIRLWLGEEYLLDWPVVVAISVNFYLMGVRNSLWVFRDAMGLYWRDRFRPLPELAVGIVASLILGQYMGVLGVLIGSALSLILVSLPIEPFVLFRHGFNSRLSAYFGRYAMRALITSLLGVATWSICQQISMDGWPGFVMLALICAVLPNVTNIVLFWRTTEFIRIRTLISRK